MKLVEKKYLLPFVVITVLFALWGFANDITNPMVAAFQTLMELPAAEASPQQVYQGEVEMSDIYLGLYGNKYGYEDAEGVSPTEREYDRAAELHKTRLIFIKNVAEDQRHPKENALIKKTKIPFTLRRWFVDGS